MDGNKVGIEQVIYKLRPSWQYFWSWILLMSVVISILVKVDQWSLSLFFFLILVGLILFLRFRHLYLVSNIRVISREGLIARHEVEIQLRHIRAFNVKQSVIGRILSYGDIEISSAADSAIKVVLKGVCSPYELKERIRELRE
jgi:uncharacterized membrane protein YdbT with pleckstrin-like domain